MSLLYVCARIQRRRKHGWGILLQELIHPNIKLIKGDDSSKESLIILTRGAELPSMTCLAQVTT